MDRFLAGVRANRIAVHDFQHSNRQEMGVLSVSVLGLTSPTTPTDEWVRNWAADAHGLTDLPLTPENTSVGHVLPF